MMKPCYSSTTKEMLPCNEFSAKQWAKDENKAGRPDRRAPSASTPATR